MSASHPTSDVPPEPPPVVPGQILAGKFRIERVIGEGGMGIVAEATHLGLDERVALKFLRREVMRMPDVVARFDREARSAVKLKSEHVARVSDVGKTEDGIPFMVMELLHGKDLAQMVTEQGPLPIPEAVEYVIQACEGVGEAHARGIVHRDLKPENLFVVKRDHGWAIVKVLDFGISKAVLVGTSSVDLQSNSTTSIMGSPYYMSPEQLRSTRSVDHRADIWSLGVVLFELLTGTTIFDETKEFTELVADILETPHRELGMFRLDAPPGLEMVIDRCLEKDRTKRYQNVAELAVALLPFAPRRARVTAERTTSITRSAGLITDPNFHVPPSVYPPGVPSASSDSYPSGSGLAPPGLPGDFSARAPTPLNLAGAPQSTPSPPAGAVETLAAPPPRKPMSATLLALGAMLLLLLGVGLAYGVIRTLKSATAATQPTVTTPLPQPTDTQTSKTQPSPSATEIATTATTESTTAHTAATSRPHVPIGTARPPVTSTATASAPPTATTAHPSLDIQLQR